MNQIICCPKIEVGPSIEKYLLFASQYNADKEIKDQLRPQHLKLFTRMMRILAHKTYQVNQWYQNNEPTKCELFVGDPLKLKTNRSQLSWLDHGLKIHPNTVGRQITRLTKAGIITGKRNHGPELDFDLLINPGLVLITDLSRIENAKISTNFVNESFLEKSDVQNVQKPKSPEICSYYQEHSNNLTIPFNRFSASPQNSVTSSINEQHKQEHREIEAIQTEKSSGFEKKSEPDTDHSLRWYQKSAARWFFWYTFKTLFENNNVWPAEINNSLAYCEQNYFVNCSYKSDVDRLKALYKWRIDKAKAHIQLHNIDIRFIFPSRYLDLSNKGLNSNGTLKFSFANTVEWPEKYKALVKKRAGDLKKSTDDTKFNRMLRIVSNNPTMDNYHKVEQYVMRNMSYMLPQYYASMGAEHPSLKTLSK